ncbi:MAG: MATE family efflux transporter [Ruminococcaceae bacterium]|nr:MATE family efflux transporter [Oscillospiraceae bacterium]
MRKKLDLRMLGLIVSLAWPTMLEQLMQTAVQYVDTAMVASLGTYATAAVGCTGTVSWLIGSTVSAMSTGFLSGIARSFGEKNEEKARKIAAQAVLMALFAGTFFTITALVLSPYVPVWMRADKSIRTIASEYFFILYSAMIFRATITVFGTVLRASGDTKTPMKVGVAVNLVNVAMNFLLIYPTRRIELFSFGFTMPGADLGVRGAAIASAASFAVGGVCIAAALFRHPRISPAKQSFLPDKSILIPCLKVSAPNMLQWLGTSMGYVVFASMINSVGDIATAAHSVANTVESAFYIPGYGMQTAAATLMGNAYGARDKKEMKELASMLIPFEIVLMILSGACLFISAPYLVDIFSNDKQVIDLGVTVLRMVALSEPFYGFSIIMEGMMIGVGRTKAPFIYNISGMWLVRIFGTFIATQLLSMGLVSAWACMILHNMYIFVLYLITFVRKKWNPLADER